MKQNVRIKYIKAPNPLEPYVCVLHMDGVKTGPFLPAVPHNSTKASSVKASGMLPLQSLDWHVGRIQGHSETLSCLVSSG